MKGSALSASIQPEQLCAKSLQSLRSGKGRDMLCASDGNRCEGCKEKRELDLSLVVKMNLYEKYERAIQNTYNINIVSDLIVSANTHISTLFKDFLIYDSDAEHLKECYNLEQAKQKTHELSTSLKEAATIPNYAIIEEKKFIFKNMKKKAKYKSMETQKSQNKISTILTKNLMDELVRRTTNIPVRNISKLNLIDLVDKFIDRDSLSLINHTNCTNVKVPFTIPVGKQRRAETQGRAAQLGSALNKKDVSRISPISRTKGKARHTSQGYLNEESKAKLKSENVDKNDGRMTAIGYYPTKRIKVSKKIFAEAKPKVDIIKAAKGNVKEGELEKKKAARMNAGSALGVKGSKMSPRNDAECTKTYNKPKENIEAKIHDIKKPKPFQIQSENRPCTSTLIRKTQTSSTINAKLKKIVTPKEKNRKGGFPSSRNSKKLVAKAEVGPRVVSALGNNSKKKLN
eukprot:TRINITY_DN3239_c0_g1_i2.p1 TRINITY_DN3239_c0_g1~~TRINITY_DN3239_c0_g1_i2.p1  ORF type:complete len:458 (-),score=112.06 TRINITY_DN3239_c0_g1_i2:87-1460(-)